MERMSGSDPAGEQIERQPTTLVLMVRLILQGLGRERLADVLSSNELGIRDLGPNRGYCPLGCEALVDEGTKRRVDVVQVREPMPVKAREARCRHRLVDRVPPLDPRIAARNLTRLIGPPVGENRIEQIRVLRA